MKRFKKIKEEIIDWYWSNIRIPIIRFIEYHKIWFAYYKVCKKIYDFDYWSLYTVQRHQLIRLRDVLQKDNIYEGTERDIERINLALRLLDIIEKDDFVDHVDEYGKLIRSIDRWDEGTWICNKKVNLRNVSRYGVNYKRDGDLGEILKGHLYVYKAWCLYHKLLTYYARNWWS